MHQFGGHRFSTLWKRSMLRGSTNRLRDGQHSRRFLSDVAFKKKGSLTKQESTLVEQVIGVETRVVRHGVGDGVVTLNVGGKEFITLRSTLMINPVLRKHVQMAEKNQEFTNGAVFIDRDPSQFGLILQHLRNRADVISSTSLKVQQKFFYTKHHVLIQIPKDTTKARELFVEARYFQISELEKILCTYDFFTRFSSWVGGGTANPFHAATQAITNARTALLAASGFGVLVGTQNDDFLSRMNSYINNILSPPDPKKSP